MPITITTTSSKDLGYFDDPANAIFPAFLDNMPYESWGPGTTVATSFAQHFQLKATGAASYSWSLLSGKLPPGLSLIADGKISGKPTTKGTYTFTVQALGNTGEKARKALTLTVHPPRTWWLEQAKFGVFTGIGPGAVVDINQPYSPAGIALWESMVAAGFNPAVWVDKAISWGAKVINTNAMSADAFRLWPSTTITPRQFRSTRDYVGELIAECHKKGIFYSAYFAGDTYRRDPKYQSEDPAQTVTNGNAGEANTKSTYSEDPTKFNGPGLTNGKPVPGTSGWNSDGPFPSTWGARNVSLVTELVKKRPDEIWFDVGAADPATYPVGAIETAFMPWDKLWPAIRFNNPFVVVGINPGTSNQGGTWQYPRFDVVYFEGLQGYLDLTMTTPVRVTREKRLAVEVVNPLDTWSIIDANSVDPIHKSPEKVIYSIERAWRAGAAYYLAVGSMPDGRITSEVYDATLDGIGAYVRANQGFSEEPTISLSGRTVTIGLPKGAIVYYTLDGSDPTESSQIYSAPFLIPDKTCTIRAATKQASLPLSIVASATYESEVIEPSSLYKKLFAAVTGDALVTEAESLYRGMMFRVKQNPVIIHKIGKKGAIPSSHEVLFKTEWNNDTVFYRRCAFTEVDADGYIYATIPPLSLEAGRRYHVTIKETPVKQYYSNSFAAIPVNDDIVVVGNRILNPNGDINPVVQNGVGQFVNLVYEPVLNPSKDFLVGRPAVFQNSSTWAVVAGLNEYQSDGDIYSFAGPATNPTYYIHDMEAVRLINTIEIYFPRDRHSEDMEIYTSILPSSPVLLASRKGNRLFKVTFKFDAIKARYIYFKNTYPVTFPTSGRRVGAAASDIRAYLK